MSNRGRKCNEDIALGLAVLSAMRAPGERFSSDVIAAACNCSRWMIYRIEKKALRKLANRLRFLKDPGLREAVATVIGREP